MASHANEAKPGAKRGRPRGSRNRSTLEFRQRYEQRRRALERQNKATGADEATDPFDVLWSLCLDRNVEAQHRIAAGRELLRYRYPTMKAIEVNANGEAIEGASGGQGQLTLAWDADAA